MKVFISWSGDRSKKIAESIRKWIPKVIQATKPWMSNEDISSGLRWSIEVSKELENTKIGIVCVTPENQHNPWILFESGALSKSIEHTYVIPYLFDMSPSQLSGPLVQFQAVKANKEGTYKLLLAMNKALGNIGLDESELQEVFDVWWVKLEGMLNEIPEYTGEKDITRSQSEILEEILENTREHLRKEELRLNTVLDKENDMDKLLNEFKNHVGSFSKRRDILLEMLKKEEGEEETTELINQNKMGNLDILNIDFDEAVGKLSQVMQKQKSLTKELLENKNNEEEK